MFSESSRSYPFKLRLLAATLAVVLAGVISGCSSASGREVLVDVKTDTLEAHKPHALSFPNESEWGFGEAYEVKVEPGKLTQTVAEVSFTNTGTKVESLYANFDFELREANDAVSVQMVIEREDGGVQRVVVPRPDVHGEMSDSRDEYRVGTLAPGESVNLSWVVVMTGHVADIDQKTARFSFWIDEFLHT